jgi:hypothetical protein
MAEKFRPIDWSLTTSSAQNAWLRDLDRVNRKHGVMGTSTITLNMTQRWSSAELKALRTGAHTLQALRAAAFASHPVRKANLAARDIDLAKIFLQRRDTARKHGFAKSDSAIMAEIGGALELSRSAAIAAINRGLKLLGHK